MQPRFLESRPQNWDTSDFDHRFKKKDKRGIARSFMAEEQWQLQGEVAWEMGLKKIGQTCYT